MRRSSIITITLLVLVIIALIIALVVTNYPQAEETENSQNETLEQNSQDLNEEDTVDETPTGVDLTSSIAVEFSNILSVSQSSIIYDYFYEFQTDTLDQNNMSDTRKLQIAYDKVIYPANGQYVSSISKSDMDEAMLSVFGNTNYTPQAFNNGGIYYNYDSASNSFVAAGNGGGGQGTHYITGIYKIEEYSDRYVVYAKALVLEVKSSATNSSGVGIGTIWDIKNADSLSADYSLHTFVKLNVEDTEGRYSNYSTYDSLISGVSDITFAKPSTEQDVSSLSSFVTPSESYKLLSKYYDSAMEFKHTFMKNDDGTYYWLKTERL